MSDERLIYVEMMLEKIMDKLQLHRTHRGPSVEQCIMATAAHYDLSPQNFLSRQRNAEISTARQIAMFIARRLTTHSSVTIGRKFHRDHTTVLHSLRRIEKLQTTSRDIAQDIDAITYKILHQPNGSHVPPDTGEPSGQGDPLSAGAARSEGAVADRQVAAPPIQGSA